MKQKLLDDFLQELDKERNNFTKKLQEKQFRIEELEFKLSVLQEEKDNTKPKSSTAPVQPQTRERSASTSSVQSSSYPPPLPSNAIPSSTASNRRNSIGLNSKVNNPISRTASSSAIPKVQVPVVSLDQPEEKDPLAQFKVPSKPVGGRRTTLAGGKSNALPSSLSTSSSKKTCSTGSPLVSLHSESNNILPPSESTPSCSSIPPLKQDENFLSLDTKIKTLVQKEIENKLPNVNDKSRRQSLVNGSKIPIRRQSSLKDSVQNLLQVRKELQC